MCLHDNIWEWVLSVYIKQNDCTMCFGSKPRSHITYGKRGSRRNCMIGWNSNPREMEGMEMFGCKSGHRLSDGCMFISGCFPLRCFALGSRCPARLLCRKKHWRQQIQWQRKSLNYRWQCGLTKRSRFGCLSFSGWSLLADAVTTPSGYEEHAFHLQTFKSINTQANAVVFNFLFIKGSWKKMLWGPQT